MQTADFPLLSFKTPSILYKHEKRDETKPLVKSHADIILNFPSVKILHFTGIIKCFTERVKSLRTTREVPADV